MDTIAEHRITTTSKELSPAFPLAQYPCIKKWFITALLLSFAKGSLASIEIHSTQQSFYSVTTPIFTFELRGSKNYRLKASWALSHQGQIIDTGVQKISVTKHRPYNLDIKFKAPSVNKNKQINLDLTLDINSFQDRDFNVRKTQKITVLGSLIKPDNIIDFLGSSGIHLWDEEGELSTLFSTLAIPHKVLNTGNAYTPIEHDHCYIIAHGQHLGGSIASFITRAVTNSGRVLIFQPSTGNINLTALGQDISLTLNQCDNTSVATKKLRLSALANNATISVTNTPAGCDSAHVVHQLSKGAITLANNPTITDLLNTPESMPAFNRLLKSCLSIPNDDE